MSRKLARQNSVKNGKNLDSHSIKRKQNYKQSKNALERIIDDEESNSQAFQKKNTTIFELILRGKHT